MRGFVKTAAAIGCGLMMGVFATGDAASAMPIGGATIAPASSTAGLIEHTQYYGGYGYGNPYRYGYPYAYGYGRGLGYGRGYGYGYGRGYGYYGRGRGRFYR